MAKGAPWEMALRPYPMGGQLNESAKSNRTWRTRYGTLIVVCPVVVRPIESVTVTVTRLFPLCAAS